MKRNCVTLLYVKVALGYGDANLLMSAGICGMDLLLMPYILHLWTFPVMVAGFKYMMHINFASFWISVVRGRAQTSYFLA
jgi:hypothetical protein